MRRRNPTRKASAKSAAPSTLPMWLMLGLGGGALYLLYQVTQSISNAEASVSSAAGGVSGALNSIAGSAGAASAAAQSTSAVASQTIQDTGAAAQNAANAAASTASAWDPSSLWDDVTGEDDGS